MKRSVCEFFSSSHYTRLHIQAHIEWKNQYFQLPTVPQTAHTTEVLKQDDGNLNFPEIDIQLIKHELQKDD